MKPEQITAMLCALTTDQLITIISRQAEVIVKLERKQAKAKNDRKLIEDLKGNEVA